MSELEAPCELDEEEFLAQFEACSFPLASFDHRAHVRLSWAYLQHHDPALALHKVSSGLRRYVAHVGHAAKYHETITWAFFAAIAERVAQSEPALSWDRFAEGFPELFSSGLLEAHYPKAQLDSDLARRVFVLPRLSEPPERS